MPIFGGPMVSPNLISVHPTLKTSPDKILHKGGLDNLFKHHSVSQPRIVRLCWNLVLGPRNGSNPLTVKSNMVHCAQMGNYTICLAFSWALW